MSSGSAAETRSTARWRRRVRAAVGATALVVFSAQRALADVAPPPPHFPAQQLSLPEAEGTLAVALYAMAIATILRLVYLGMKKLFSVIFRSP